MTADKLTWILTGATTACVAALYLPSAQRTVPGGDSGELITAACELGVAHPPGYPLFTMLSSLALRLFPSTSPAVTVNVLCALFGAGASGALCFTVCRVSRPGPGAVLAGGMFAVSRLVWQWSVVAEVFSLNNLFVGILFSLSACFHYTEGKSQRRKFALWGALVCGLSLCNQHTVVLYAIIIIPWALLHLLSHNELSFGDLLSLGLCFLTGLVPYLYLPVSSYLNTARWSWGDQTSLTGLLTHLLRTEYGTFSLAKTEGNVNFTTMLQAQMTHCVADLSVPLLVLAGLGLLLSLWERKHAVISLLIVTMVTLYSMFFAWRANLDISKPLLLGVVERFWLQADAGVCVLAGLGLNWTVSWLEARLGQGAVWTSGGWLLAAYLLTHTVQLNHRECDQSGNDVVEVFAREIISSFPSKSLVLTRGDLPGNTLRYLHYCHGLRPDLSLVDQEMMTYSWYVAKLHKHLPGVKFPGHHWDPVNAEEKNTFSLEQFLHHNLQRPVFVCIGLPEGDPSWKRSFSNWPWGVCEHLVPAQTHFHPEKWAQRTQNLYSWHQPYNSFHPASWEKVANEEMWQARMKTPFFLFDLAERVDGQSRALLYELSYTLYCQLVDGHSDYPSNWDKNLALASERLLRVGGGGQGPDTLLSHSIHHFSLYLKKEPSDPQNKAVRTMIAHLRKERDRLRETDRHRG
ncbi:transmembrane protein 260 [Chanos chanos]|uniref:Transmembrane protein 260 n=1 Tax=Chanos chanos TaxID=29144 RepID=A0A6J2WEV4_CHACN|nr:transmembrane protein 260 [Chanos chanos]